MNFFSFDTELDLMTLLYEYELCTQKMYLHTNNEVSRSRFQQLEHKQNRHTQTDAAESIARRIHGW